MQTRHAIAALGALAQETRLGIFRLLVQAGPDGLAAGVIADKLDTVPATLSFHLQQLMFAGLIEQRRAGRSLIYTASFEAMNGLVGFLTENCCGRGVAACAPACDVPAVVDVRRSKRLGKKRNG